MSPSLKRVVLSFVLAFVFTVTGCAYKPPAAKTAPPPPPAPAPGASLSVSPNDLQQGQSAANTRSTPTDEELFSESMTDIFFAYDKSAVPANEEPVIEQDARFLVAHPYIKLLISGHCDGRGSEEYNLALGDSRADSVRDQLERLGIKADRIRTISYGKERPFCNEQTEACWQLNRRAHFSQQP